ncbi:pyridoxamine 5'-phosphate oxidase [Paracoccus sp. (in: a-proteobacteria)]|uniref:pyridoxamine 5'-phosphate oxidase n=1 Tax=Paracoccus sp. TaxID=267 RepID=UPI0026E0BB42|nr:pyridoxamine 5'-phosphate oxidase [Paracoccus sp. (in: a-proteobacteria)]MDO5646518.1 pyridoxamine 5'-phosphate oxidase [Paracoccus sp. (in: a-proteobacteria)]
MTDRSGIFAGNDPFDIARNWLAEAEKTEPNDPNAMALSTVDADGLPDVRMVLLKDIEGQGTAGSFVFYTNYNSAKGQQIAGTGKAAFVMHWKSLRRQIRVRGTVMREDGPDADAYFASRALQSRVGAWASHQSQPLDSRTTLMAEAARQGVIHGLNPPRPPFWGGFRITPVQIEFWADGAFRLHDRFRWSLNNNQAWNVVRLSP